MVQSRRVAVALARPRLPGRGRSTRCRRAGPGTAAGDGAGTSWRTGADPAHTPDGSGRCIRPGIQLRPAARVLVNTGAVGTRAADTGVVVIGHLRASG